MASGGDSGSWGTGAEEKRGEGSPGGGSQLSRAVTALQRLRALGQDRSKLGAAVGRGSPR